MPLFRQLYRVVIPLGHRLRTMLVEADTEREARVAALKIMRAKNPGLAVELRGDPQIVEVPADWMARKHVTRELHVVHGMPNRRSSEDN